MRSASPLDSKKLSVRPQTSPHGRMGDLGGKRGKSSPGTVAGIRKNGVIEPIVFLDGSILNGRNRYMAARKLGIEYPRVEYEGTDPLGFVIAKNLARRHLTESQRGTACR